LIPLLAASALLAAPASLSATRAQPALFFALGQTRQLATSYTPAQIQQAYDVKSMLDRGVDGTGQTIALIELDRFNVADLQEFDAANQLPDPTIREFYPNGKTFARTAGLETTLDIEWAHALAPGAAIQVYYLKNGQPSASGWRGFATALSAAASGGAGTISISFGACRTSTGYKAVQKALAAALGAGVSVFVSSGDSGQYPGPRHECGSKPGVTYPASDPSVVSVGGTSLTLADDNSTLAETAWQLSGGGKGSPLRRPSWQMALTLLPGKYRYVPDVAFLGDPSTGVAVYFNGRWGQAGGTSLGSPAWAGIWALIREDAQKAGKQVGTAPTVLYRVANSPSYVQAFDDITSGSNGRYKAKPGWDAVTGWGTPRVSGLAASALALSPTP